MGFLEWLLKVLLGFLKDWAVQEAKAKAAQIKKEKEQGITNEANVKKYRDAVAREERIRAATDLLNRNRT